jgi:hypothetical protein
MIKYLPKIFTFLFITAMLAACSSDDSATPEQPGEPNGGEAFQAEIVTITMPEDQLSQMEYQGTINGVPVTLIKSEDGKLVFVMPPSLPAGTYDLVIPALDNTTITYTVQPTVLTGTAEETLTDFVAGLNAFAAILDNSQEGDALQQTIDSFNEYYSNAPAEEKTQMAIAYKANKALFDMLLSTDNTGRGIVESTRAYVNKHKLAVAVMAVGVGLVFSPGYAVLGVAAIGVGAYKAYKANTEAHENVLTAIKVEVGGWFGSNDRNANTDDLVLEDGRSKTFSFNFGERQFIASDANKTEPIAVEYFEAVEKYNYYADKVNPVIDNTNDVKGTNFSNIQDEIVPATSPEVSTQVTPELFENIDFSFNHPNVSLTSASVTAEGQLTLKVQITGNPSTLPFNADLRYSYSDGLSTFSGKLPVTIMPSVIGTWTLQSFENGTPVGQYFNYAFAEDCSSLALAGYTITTETYTIGETTYSYSGNEITRQYNLEWSGCTVLSNGPDQDESFPYSGSGTYTLENGTYIAIEGGETHVLAFQWITKDKIKIDDKIYTRN